MRKQAWKKYWFLAATKLEIVYVMLSSVALWEQQHCGLLPQADAQATEDIYPAYEQQKNAIQSTGW